MLVLCGETMFGVDAGGTGKLIWPKPGQRRRPPLSGPAVVIGQTVIAPTADGFVQLDVGTGEERPAYAVPNFRRFLGTDAARAAVNDAGAARAVGLASGSR